MHVHVYIERAVSAAGIYHKNQRSLTHCQGLQALRRWRNSVSTQGTVEDLYIWSAVQLPY